jgi:hypothetical protein
VPSSCQGSRIMYQKKVMTKASIKSLKLELDQIVCVVWEDIATESAWMDKDDVEYFRPPLCRSFGAYGGVVNGGVFVKHNTSDNKDAVTKETDNNFDGTIIPLGCVVRIRKLKVT